MSRVAPLRVSLLVVFLLTAAGLLMSLAPQARLADLWLVDVDFSLLRQLAPHAAPDDFVLIGIDEAIIRSPADAPSAWQRPLGGLLRGIATGRPRMVVLDAGLPASPLRPAEQAELLAGLAALQRVAPVVTAPPRGSDGREQEILPDLAAALGPNTVGVREMPVDPDARHRRLAFFAGEPPKSRETLVALAARAVSPTIYHAPAMIDFALGPKYDYLPMSAALEITGSGNADELRRRFGDRIVFVGFVLPAADRERLALNLMSGERASMAAPGVALQAQALRTVIHGTPVMPIVDWLLWPLYLAPACLFLLRRGRSVLLAGMALVVLSLAAKIWALHAGTEVPIAGFLATTALAMIVWQGFAGRRPA